MNTSLIIGWMIFITVLLLIFGVSYYREDHRLKLSSNFNLNRQALLTIRDKTGSAFISYYPETKVSHLSEKLLWAGEPWGLTAQSFIGLQFSLMILCLIIGLNLAIFNIPIIVTIIIAAIAFFTPHLFLNEKINQRKSDIERDIPIMVGLLSTSIRAGVELIPSFQAISYNMPGSLGDELRMVWTQTATGKHLPKALHEMANRTGVSLLKNFVETIITTQERGSTDLSETLSDFTHTVLESQRRRAQEEAKKKPTKMLLPMFLCIFVPMLVLILTPAALSIMKTF